MANVWSESDGKLEHSVIERGIGPQIYGMGHPKGHTINVQAAKASSVRRTCATGRLQIRQAPWSLGAFQLCLHNHRYQKNKHESITTSHSGGEEKKSWWIYPSFYPILPCLSHDPHLQSYTLPLAEILHSYFNVLFLCNCGYFVYLVHGC